MFACKRGDLDRDAFVIQLKATRVVLIWCAAAQGPKFIVIFTVLKEWID